MSSESARQGSKVESCTALGNAEDPCDKQTSPWAEDREIDGSSCASPLLTHTVWSPAEKRGYSGTLKSDRRRSRIEEGARTVEDFTIY